MFKAIDCLSSSRSGQYFETIKCLQWFSGFPESPTLVDIQDDSVMPTCEKTVIQHHASDLPSRWTHRGIHAAGGRDRQRLRMKEKKAIAVPPLHNHFSFSDDDSMQIWVKLLLPSVTSCVLQRKRNETWAGRWDCKALIFCVLVITQNAFFCLVLFCVHILLTCSLFVLQVPKQR